MQRNPKIIVVMYGSNYVNTLSLKTGTTKTTILTQQEISFLDLFAKNFTDQDICYALSLTSKEINVIKQSVKRKLKASSWLQVMKLCFDMGVLSPCNYISEYVEVYAREYTNRILNCLNSNNQTNKVYNLQSLLAQFYESCENHYTNNSILLKHEMGILNAPEKKYLLLKFHGFSEVTILSKLNINPKLVFMTKRQLLQELKVNSLYNAYRKGLEFKVIGHSHSKISKSYRFKKRLNYSHKVCSVYLEATLNQPLKDVIIRTLISFYAEMHYAKLFSQLEKHN